MFFLNKWVSLGISDRIRIGLIMFMQIGFVGAFFFALYERAWLTMFISVVALVVVWFPYLLERQFRFRIPLEFVFFA